MKFTLTPRNAFYDGWLAWILGIAPQRRHGGDFREGWKMADETAGEGTSGVGKSLMLDALVKAIAQGHIKLTIEEPRI